MNSVNFSTKNKNNKNKQAAQEPPSAHATKVVEKYIRARNTKAKKQIKQEENSNFSTK